MTVTITHRKTMIRRALQYVHALNRRDAEYAEECESYRRDGHRPHYCKHGVDMWTDYDNICGPCEDSMSNYETALMWARNDVAEMERRTEWVLAAPTNVPRDTMEDLINWAVEPITREV